MRKPSNYSLKAEEESDYSTSAAASTQAYLDDTTISPHDSYNNKEHSDDSDCFSNSSKKIRKKRQAYSKISDEIRMKLLDCVKNGETLKSAAKRFKINYSSAKSILHTFRKEGRILKKSAQERTIKKKPESMFDVDSTPKSARLAKKNSMNLHDDISNASKSMNNLNARDYSKESTPVGSLSRLDEGVYDQHHYQQAPMEQDVSHNEHYMHKMNHHEDVQNHYNKMNYYMNYNDSLAHQHHHDVTRNYMLTEGLEHNNHGRSYPVREFDPFHDMVSMQHRPNHVDEFFTEPSAAYNAHHGEDRFFRNEHGGEFHEQGEHGYNPLKSFMDTQSIFRDALKRANNVSYSNSNHSVVRKSSIDLF